MYRCVVIDDEAHAIDGIKKYIDNVPELKLVATYTDPLLALKEIGGLGAIDLIFLDVDMPKITGIELAKEIRGRTKKLVFTTAHTKYAYDAFKADADDYLLKPYSLGQFLICINKLFPKHEQHTIEAKPKEAKADFFFVKSREESPKLVKISYSDILMVESKRNYVLIYTKHKQVLTYMSLTEIANILQEHSDFIQLQRGFIIKKEAIESVDGHSVKIINGIELIVGDNYRKEFAVFIAENWLRTGKSN